MRLPSPIQSFFQTDNCWWNFHQAHGDTLRPAIVENMVKILSCGAMVRGYKTYDCSNDECSHTKQVSFSCKSRFCPTCGKKATDLWINKQRDTLPHTDWQHITLTVPGKLWPLFEQDRTLLDELPRIAANIFLRIAKKRNLKVGIFTAMHTFGRDLKWHVHIHLSVTLGGLSLDNARWQALRFAKRAVMPMWRARVIKMMRKAKKQNRIDITCACLEIQYHKHWIVHFAKPANTSWNIVAYLGRYLKRPPLSQSRLAHYDGKTVSFDYLNHRNQKYQKATYDTHEFIRRFIQHIPDKGFRMIRYYGFLANRVRGKLLPIIYKLLNQKIKNPAFIGWAGLLKNAFGNNPLKCLLCQADMQLTSMNFGMNINQLLDNHEKIAKRKIIA